MPTLIIHGNEDSLINIEHSREIYKNLHKNTYKKLLEAPGEHNDVRSPNDIDTIKDFLMKFSYDPTILVEHQRRLKLRKIKLEDWDKFSMSMGSLMENHKNNRKMKNFDLNINNSKKNTPSCIKIITRSKSNDNKTIRHEELKVFSNKEDVIKRQSRRRYKSEINLKNILSHINESFTGKENDSADLDMKFTERNSKFSEMFERLKRNKGFSFEPLNENQIKIDLLTNLFRGELQENNKIRNDRLNNLGHILSPNVRISAENFLILDIDKKIAKKQR